MSKETIVTTSSDRVQEYVDRFGSPPPFLYLSHLDDEELAARIALAIDTGEEIGTDDIDSQAADLTDVF